MRESAGARSKKKLVPRVLILLTDGKSSDEVRYASRRVHRDGVTTFVIGITRAIDAYQLLAIASKPTEKIMKIDPKISKIKKIDPKIFENFFFPKNFHIFSVLQPTFSTSKITTL